MKQNIKDIITKIPNSNDILVSIPHSDEAFEMVFVKGGTFNMASEYKVTLDSYYIARFPVTQGQWAAVLRWAKVKGLPFSLPENPSYHSGINHPVEQVSWDDCKSFIALLHDLCGLKDIFSLPTEAEWEYAARGGRQSKGSEYAGSDDIHTVAWYHDNSHRETKPVGLKKPNELKLYDMSGNVWEWCEDWYGEYPKSPKTNHIGAKKGAYRVVRGGSRGFNAPGCRLANRSSNSPGHRGNDIGWRLRAFFSLGSL